MKHTRIVALVQARLNSTRLPRKVALPLIGYPMLYHLCQRLQRVPSINSVAVIVPPRNFPYMKTLVPAGVRVLGPSCAESDVVRRHLLAALHYRADLIVRVPSDNPCVDPDYVEAAIQTYLNNWHYYYSNTTALCGDTWVDGIGAEVCSVSRWRWLDRRTKDQPELREHPHRTFEAEGYIALPEADVRLDVNTPEDYRFISDLYTSFGHNRFTTEDVLASEIVQAKRAARWTHAEAR